jgi:hypothetical protein
MKKAWSAKSARRVKILFVHIPKTAGISIYRGIERAYGMDKCIRFAQLTERDKYRAMSDEEVAHYDLLSGHFPFSIFAEKDISQFRAVALVRDPVDRLLSEYFYVRGWPEHPMHEQYSALSLDEFLAYKASDQRKNPQCWYFSEKGTFESAREVIRKHFDLVGTYAALEAFWSQLKLLAKAEFGELPVENTTSSRLPLGEVDTRIKQAVEAMVPEDVKLYSFVTERAIVRGSHE